MKTKVKTRQPGKRGTFGHYFKAHWQLYMMVAFPVIMLAVFSYAPMYGILLAFKNYRIVDGIWGSPWAAHFGLDNFIRFFNNYNFMESLRNTLVISLYTLVVNTPCAIILALALNYVRKVKFKKFVQMVTYLPYFISTIVFVGILNAVFDTRVGAVGSFFYENMGMNILGTPELFFFCICMERRVADGRLRFHHLYRGACRCGYGAA